MRINKTTILPILALAFLGCASTQTLQKEAPIAIENSYFQRWNAGVRGAGSGIDIYIETNQKNDNQAILDSVYFRKRGTKLNQSEGQNGLIYSGNFKIEYKLDQDIIMSSDPVEESKNKLKPLPKIPFELQDNDCVVSYIKDGKTYYYKIENINEKQTINYPSAPPQRH